MALLNLPNDLSLAYLDTLLRQGGKTVLLLAATVLLLMLLKKGLAIIFRSDTEPLGGRRARLKTLADSLYHLLSLCIWFVAVLTILSGWNINVTPLLTGAGLIGLAIGLGSQTLIKDLVAGFFIILENQYNQGDVVTLAGVKGVVQKITLRTTTLRDQDGNIAIITNSQILLVTRHAQRD